LLDRHLLKAGPAEILMRQILRMLDRGWSDLSGGSGEP